MPKRLDDKTIKLRTPYGERHQSPDGWTHYTSEPDETQAFAHRAGQRWPCSVLAGHFVSATIAPNGDLVDLDTGDSEEASAAEVTAWMEAIDSGRK